MNKNAADGQATGGQPEVMVGKRLHDLRVGRGLSLRALAQRSGLNVNTLSLVENGKSSPSVSTLQQLALALEVPIGAFFQSAPAARRVVFTPADQRPEEVFGTMRMQNLGKDLAGNAVQPFVVTLEPGKGSGERNLVHTGHEFVYCLGGSIHYQVEGEVFNLNAGDSLLFEAHLAHCWVNNGQSAAQILLVLYPSDEREETGGRHFTLETMKKEINMKIAIVTDDGKTISQHFGRAAYYMVLTIEEGKITSREMRDKLGHNQFQAHHHGDEGHGQGHGMEMGSHNKHVQMAEVIADCSTLICGGMGAGAYESMRRLNIKPVVTDLVEIDAAAEAFITGKLVDHTELLH